ncbi:MAG: hypothetical protein E7293_05340 [Lachnospiraceae bacterium]|nr:hypothetical protein [Lachnospiraceae bacterium]
MLQDQFEYAKEKVVGTQRQRQGIGTLSEKTVHAVLKNYYAPDEDMHEFSIENYVADIYTGTEIIEIQTRQFYRMRDKLAAFLPLYPVTIVYPIPREKWLNLIDEESGEVFGRRKSPVKGTVYHVFPELYRIKMFLKDPNLKIRLVLMDMEEYRRANNKSRKKRKDSVKLDRVPLCLIEETEIKGMQDYRQFIPSQLTGTFTVKDFAKAARIRQPLAQVTLNLLYYAEVVERVGKQGNAWIYHVVF